MAYGYSHVDRRNNGWFRNDTSRATLLRIQIWEGEIRGLRELDIQFLYPITAIAGANGSGKTTILALAACAFHGEPDGYRHRGRSAPYYTFSDFFAQTVDEVPLEGIRIGYQIRHNRWRRSRHAPDGVGDFWQERKKRRGGRWNNYERRVNRPVAFLGIDRLVPHAEKSTSKSYRKLFHHAQTAGWEEELCEIVGRILGRTYRDFEYRQHSRYRLPFVRFGRRSYSGFNMGAGEDALFELISTCVDCPEGTLLLIDELELGLHEDAQARLVAELKTLCERRKLQIICTTHSGRVLECLPPEGRVFVERVGTHTRVVEGISARFATGRLSGKPSSELDVFVEDEVSKAVLLASLLPDLRLRTHVLPVGSKGAVVRQLAARFKEGRLLDTCAVLDGDASEGVNELESSFVRLLESADEESAREWLQRHIAFLPGDTCPETWILSRRAGALYARFDLEFGVADEAQVDEILEAGIRAGAHREVFEVARLLGVDDEEIVLYNLAKGAIECCPDDQERLTGFLEEVLAANTG